MVKFFINRPIFATVLALIIVVAGLVTLNILPIAQYPEITPPTVQVSAVYPGADAQTVAQTVGLPIEQQVNGVDGMLYMSSNSSSSGAYSLTITFAVGTDIDMATVMVQNRVSIAQSSLPEPVIVQGITTRKQSSNIVMMLTLSSKDSIYECTGLFRTEAFRQFYSLVDGNSYRHFFFLIFKLIHSQTKNCQINTVHTACLPAFGFFIDGSIDLF